MSTGDFSTHPIPIHKPAGTAPSAAEQAKRLVNLRMIQTAHSQPVEDLAQPEMFFLPTMSRRFERLETKVDKKGKEGESAKTDREKEKVAEVRRLEGVSERFQRQNYELQSRLLLLLRSRIKAGDTKDDIIKKVRDSYPDHSLADEALDFLIETSEGELKESIMAAKREFNESYGMEIRAGRNMGAQAREFAEQNLATPTALRDMYRDLVGNPREAPILFEELSKEFPYKKMKTVIEFILSALGSDLKSKGPSISRAELHRLMSEARSLQAILGIYKFFKSRMNLITSSFSRNGLSMPASLTFELIARQFMKFLQERYPSAEKALMLAEQLGISEVALAEVIIYTQMRDAVRQIAPKVFKSEQHRTDVLMALIAALEELDKDLEEEQEKEEEEEEEQEEEEKND